MKFFYLIVDFKVSPISVDCDNNIVGVTIRLRQTWMDNRICHKQDINETADIGVSIIPSRMGRDPESGIPQVIWMPNLYFFALSKMEIQTNFEQQTLMWMFEDHEGDTYVSYDSQFDLYVKCPMFYKFYPFDEQECLVSVSSADLVSSKLVFNMPKNVTKGRAPNAVGEFDTEIIQLTEDISTTLVYNSSYFMADKHEDHQVKSTWAYTGFKLKLDRRYSRHVFNYYLPTIMMVLLSWVSFLVPQDDVNARIALLVTMLLVVVTILNTANDNSPNAREGPTALLFWILSMIFFIFLALLCHCAAMLYRRRKEVVVPTARKNSCYKEPQALDRQTSSIPLVQQGKSGDNNDPSPEDQKPELFRFRKSKKTMMDFAIFPILCIVLLLYSIVYICVCI